ncbi:tigger transposable element-derived protein 4-like [Euwallacea similis]|uniref:tigger transposable element-derived protein 4-like n=1 Tax=Euwallacea similis TaxID=1736056 RepID=UPI00344C0920
MTSKLQLLDQGIIQNVKCHYRRRILRKTIKCLEENKTINITLMDCVDEVNSAWNTDVRPETISNCFKKAGFGQYSEWENEDEIPLIFISERLKERREEEIQLQMEYEAWKNLKGKEGVTFNDYVNVDDDIVTSEFPTNEDIIEFCRSESEPPDNKDDNDSDVENTLEDNLPQPPSNTLVANSISVLRSFLKTNEHTTNSLYNGLNNIEAFFENQIKKPYRQSQITEFFKLT